MRFEERTRMCRDAGINPDTAQNNAWVVRRDASQGREKLKFGHYAAVMALPPAEADKLLYLATREKMWSVQTLRTAVDQEKARPRRKELVQERAPCARSVVSPVKPEPSVLSQKFV